MLCAGHPAGEPVEEDAVLRNIDPLLTGALLRLLDEIGHGQVLGLVDRNFPAYAYGKPVVDLRGADTAEAARAVISVYPLDSFVDEPVVRMEINDHPDEINDSTAALQKVADEIEGRTITIGSLERFAFYDAAKEASAFVQTGETIGYSCYLLRKGVV